MHTKKIYQEVNNRYGAITKSDTGRYEQNVAKAFGYTEEELALVPEGANLGLSCGNPLALARLRRGETVIDLGSGAGFDVFAAAKRIGPEGRAIGVDMNKDMLQKANINKTYTDSFNVQFIESLITSIALPDNTADCIISNCVINLVPVGDKQAVFDEIFRLLKPGGRVAISDILARKQLTTEVKKNIGLYVGCIAGASQVSEYEVYLKNSGFEDIVIVDSKSDLNVYLDAEDERSCCGTNDAIKAENLSGTDNRSCCGEGSSSHATQSQMISVTWEVKTQVSRLGITDMNEWAGSFQVYAVKPAT